MVISRTPIENGIDFYSKTLIRTPVTKTTSNIDGDETLTEGTPVSFKGALYRKTDGVVPDKIGIFNDADAVLLVKVSVTINHYDKITYDNQDYRIIKPPITRTLGGTTIYKRVDLALL